MNDAFYTVPIEASLWLYPLAAGVGVFLLVELEKYIVSKISGSRE